MKKKIYKKIVSAIETTLRQIRDNPEHPIRERFDEALRKFIDDLHNSPSARARAEAIKHDVIDAAVTRRFAASLWQDARESLIRHAEQPETATPDVMLRLGETVLADEELMKKVDQGIVDVAEMLAERFREEVAGLIADTVAGWDPEATSNRIELAVGSDLQYIRINGTLVAGLAGLVIYTLSLLF